MDHNQNTVTAHPETCKRLSNKNNFSNIPTDALAFLLSRSHNFKRSPTGFSGFRCNMTSLFDAKSKSTFNGNKIYKGRSINNDLDSIV